MYKDLKNKVALVTGIGQMGDPNMWGNGAAISKVLACENGVKVFGCDLNLDAAEHTKKRIEAEGGICDVMAADGESILSWNLSLHAVLATRTELW